MRESTLLVVGRDDALLETIEGLVDEVDGLGFDVVEGLDQAYRYSDWDRVALVMLHHPKGGGAISGGVRLLRMIAAARRPIATLILADDLDEAARVELIQLGAADVLPGPFDLKRLSYLTDTLTLRARPAVVTPARANPEEEIPRDREPTSSAMVQARRVAGMDATVLVGGEPGAGKSRLARTIHEFSDRRGGPFVVVPCRDLEPEEFEEEGPIAAHCPGGRDRFHSRLVEASGGTLVLDGVEMLPPIGQAALLRWIEEGVRDSATLAPPVRRPDRPRLIALATAPLARAATEGRFRSDLFYRLNVIGIQLGPLRDRRDEVAGLAGEILAELSGRPVVLAADAASALASHDWPGNVSELRDLLSEALAPGGPGEDVRRRGVTFRRSHLPARFLAPQGGDALAARPMSRSAESVTLAQTKRDAEFARITQALEKHNQNRLRTASELGISRMTLYKKLYKYGIIDPGPREAGRSTFAGGGRGGVALVPAPTNGPRLSGPRSSGRTDGSGTAESSGSGVG